MASAMGAAAAGEYRGRSGPALADPASTRHSGHHQVKDPEAEAMAAIQRWSVTLAGNPRGRRRWLAENGQFTSDPTRALRLSDPEVAVQRLQLFLQLRGWEPELIERFQLVPAPPLRGSSGRIPAPSLPLAA
jgi:hypothetical protein